MLVFLLVSGFLVGILSGLLGIGGGIIFAPLLLYVPGWLGLSVLSMKTVTGLTMVQALAGSTSGYLAHRRYRTVSQPLIFLTGPVIILATFSGAQLSGLFGDTILKVIFALMALGAALLMQMKGKPENHRVEPAEEPAKELEFNRGLAVLVVGMIGFTGGLVGQGGAFLLVPALISILYFPAKVAMGSSLGIVVLASLAGVGGKFSAGLVDPLNALALILGAAPGAQLGSYLSQRLNSEILKQLLSGLLVLVSMQILWNIWK
ncbi:MAG: sulfite exporter TauE/SafE family protein [Clostridia bacterium]|jgi:uncharacterized membrane protein YfcA|nr:sulfite exporter TauE/SafE family protein [Clostridia bacterium]